MTSQFDELPVPGAPLKAEIHPQNQAILDLEVARRVEMTRSRLTRVQLFQARREYARLHRQLNRAKFNELVMQRAGLLEEYHQLLAAWRQNPTDKRKTKLDKVKADGRAVQQKIHQLKPVLDQFTAVKRRLDTHEKVLQLEREERENQAAFFREAATWEAQIRSVFEQSPRLHNVTEDSQKKRKIDCPKIDRIIIKPDKIYFHVKTSKQNLIQRFTGRWTSALPYGVDANDLISDTTLANLSFACGRVVTVEIGKAGKNIYYVISRMDSQDGIPNKIKFDQITDFYPVERHSATPWAAGIGDTRKITHFDFEAFPHILIGGASGGGKSNLINGILSQLISMNSPDELRLLLIDNKGGVELSHFEDTPHLLTQPVISVDRVVPALQLVRQIISQRLAAFLEIKARSLLAYNKKVKNPIPRLIVVIDEMATLTGIEESYDIHNHLAVISSQGRAVGIHLVVCTQHPSIEVLPGRIKTNFSMRIASRMPNHTASQIIVDTITAAYLPEIPGRMVFRRGGFEQILQTPLTDDDAIAKAVAIAKQYPDSKWQLGHYWNEPAKDETDTDDYTPVVVMEEPKPKFTPDDYLRIAVQIGGRLSEVRVREVVPDMAEHDLRRMKKAIVENIQKAGGRVTVEDAQYEMVKDRNTYMLRLVETDDNQTETQIEEVPV